MSLEESDASSLDAPDLPKIFPADEDYRFRLNLRLHQDPRSFLAPSNDGGALLRKRNAVLDEHPERHVGMLSEGEKQLDDLIAYVEKIGALDAGALQTIREQTSPLDRCIMLARHIETDFALMQSDKQGNRRLVGGCVCFPSSWSPEKKLGLDLLKIHGVVPGLNESLGKHVETFLSRLAPDKSVIRSDWSLKMSDELDYHPLRDLPAPDDSITLETGFVRVERQMFTGLPPSVEGNLAFAFLIRLGIYPLADFAAHPSLSRGLERAIRTMPQEVAVYKALNHARERLLTLLAASNEPRADEKHKTAET